jgi:hypothetical protein
MTIARELHKFPAEVGRMPFGDAREFMDYLGEQARAGASADTDVSEEDFRKFQAFAEPSDG